MVGLDLGLRIAVAVTLGQRLAFVGAVVVPGRVDTQTAHVQKTAERLPLARIEQHAQRLDVGLAIIVHRAPGADLAGTMDHDINIMDRLGHEARIM